MGDRRPRGRNLAAAGDCVGSENSLDNGWRNGTASWGLKTNLTWLAGFATP